MQMLGTSLGLGGQSGGLNPLYQIGRPRSVQLAEPPVRRQARRWNLRRVRNLPVSPSSSSVLHERSAQPDLRQRLSLVGPAPLETSAACWWEGRSRASLAALATAFENNSFRSEPTSPPCGGWRNLVSFQCLLRFQWCASRSCAANATARSRP